MYLLGLVALIAVFSSSGGFVFPLRDKKRYYLPKSLGGDYWQPFWNFGYERGRLHAGIDILPRVACNKVSELENHPVFAFGGGKIEYSANTQWGWIVLIRHSNTLQTKYLHMYRSDVKVGQTVSAGQKIGIIGWQGSSPNTIQTSHLHFEIYENGKAQDPVSFLKKVLS
jgi:murein DD-endopeptidase MepM/ murein hydrolase activator NlpD